MGNTDKVSLDKQDFGSDFKWGVSVAAYQIEGAHNCDDKGLSIWDVFTTVKGKIRNGEHANVSCDFFNNYKQDIDLIKKLNIPNFRFSISWSRLLPDGKDRISQEGISFYHKVIDYCLESGIEPWVTIYHWDLPQALELLGGWTNREIVKWFSDFVSLCAASFGSKVKHWMVMNEPTVFVGAGYFLGIHAPGRRGLKNFLPAIHHTVLSLAAGGRVLRTLLPTANIGTTFSCSHIEPQTTAKRDKQAAIRVDALINRMFIEPILGLGYPFDDLPVLKKIKKYIKEGDKEAMIFNFDFIGLQNYTREIVTHSFLTPYVWAKIIPANKRKVPTTLMKWEVYPTSIYEIIKKYNAYPQINKILITENGAAFQDHVLENNEVNDVERTNYLKEHLAQILKAKQDGYKVEGYFVWTLTDNFEWAEGYYPRFGLIHVDFNTQTRTIKNSGYWYSDFLK
ncbi:MAG: bglA 2 [Sphingobacteriales bacterium]|nr:bglA 2 [Sphingobacteriales bacterium]